MIKTLLSIVGGVAVIIGILWGILAAYTNYLIANNINPFN